METFVLITSVITAIAALVSAIAAWKATNFAKIAAESAAATDKRNLIRNILMGCRETLTITSRVKTLGDEVKSLNEELAVFTGQLGGSRPQLFINKAEEDQSKVSNIVNDINNLFSSEDDLFKMSNVEIDEIHARIIVLLAEAQSIKENLESDFQSIYDQVKAFRDRAINA